MNKIARLTAMLPAAVMSLMLSLAVLLIEQGLNLFHYGEVLDGAALIHYLTALLLIGLTAAVCSSITGLPSLSASRFGLLMVMPVAYMGGLALVFTQLSPSAGYGLKKLLVCGIPPVLGLLYLWFVVRQCETNRLVLSAGISMHLLAVCSWMAVNPEQALPLQATVRFSLQAVLIAFLFFGCFWMGIRLSRPVVLPGAVATAAASGLLFGLLLPSSPESALDFRPSKAAADEHSITQSVPNILWIVLDTLRSDHLSFYGYPRATAPYLEELSRDCVLYERVVSTSSWTVPSHASMFTGLFTREHGTHRGAGKVPSLREDHITIAEILNQAGYRTGAFSANNGMVTPATGMAQGFDLFHNFSPLPSYMIRADLIHFFIYYFGRDGSEGFLLPYPTSRVVTDAALRWIDAQPDAPWFLFLNYMEPHRPHVAPPSRRDIFPGRLRGVYDQRHRVREVGKGDSFTKEELAHFSSQYDAQIRTLDDNLRMLISGLQQRGQLDDMLIVITSDHGEHLGDHDRVSHGSASELFNAVLRVPLMIRYPRRQFVGTRVDLTSIVQIPAIVLEALPWEKLVVDPVHRARVAEILERHELMLETRFFISEKHSDGSQPGKRHLVGYAVHGERFKFISSPWTGEHLYDLANDPGETSNVLASYPGVARRLRRILGAYKSTVAEGTGGAAVLDSKDTMEALRALGYIQ